MKGQMGATAGYRAAVPSMAGLAMMMETYSPGKNANSLAPDSNELYTLNEWLLETRGIVADRRTKHILANNIAGLYRGMMLEPPTKVNRRNDKNIIKSGVMGYPRKHFGILETAYQQMEAEEAEKAEEARIKAMAADTGYDLIG